MTVASRHNHAAHGVHPFPSLVKKMEAYLEERRNITDPFCLTRTYPDRPTILPFVKLQTPKIKKTKSPKKRNRKVNHQASRKQYKVRQLEEPFSLSKAAMPTFMLASVPTTNAATTTIANLLVPSKLPSTSNVWEQSSQTSKSWPRP